MQIDLQQDIRLPEEHTRLLHDRGMHLIDVAGPAVARPFTAEQRLAAEILRQVFLDLESSDRFTRADAQAWIESDSDDLNSLVDVAETLGLSTANLREAATDPVRRQQINDRLQKEWNEGGRKSA